MMDNVVEDHESYGLVMIKGTSYCLFHARAYARRMLSRAPMRSLPGKLTGRAKVERDAEAAGQARN
jgi:hypothetical protein